MKNVIKFNNLNGINEEKIDVDWSRNSKLEKSKFHSISSYLAMFAPALPEFFINAYSNQGDVVYDPFSGRGTTALKARMMGRSAISSDLNPYAIVLSRAKVSKSNINIVKNIINSLNIKYNEEIQQWKDKVCEPKYKELSYFYHEETLAQLIFIREELGKKWRTFKSNKNVLMGIILGLMHGPTRKDGSTMYFSVDMPNTISMSPNYVKNYVIKNNLTLPIVDIFEKIVDRLEKKYDDRLSTLRPGKTLEHNATHKLNRNSVADGTINLIVTSPPYLSVVNYTHSNWLKLWILGYERKELREKIKLSDRLTMEQYIKFITKFLNNIYSKLAENAHICLVVGDVHGTKLIESVWKTIKGDVPYEFVEIYYDYIKKEKKVTNMLNNRSGKATVIEKVLVLKKK